MHASMSDPLKRLQQVQAWRAPKGWATIPAAPVSAEIARLKAAITRQSARMGDAAELWERIIPAAIREDTRLSGLAGGVLSVITGSAATTFALDRLLRGGGEARLREGSEGRIVRVRMRVGQIDRDA